MPEAPKNAQRRGPHFTRDRGRSDVADSLELEEVQRQTVWDNTVNLHGPERVEYAMDELVVLVQVRNSRHYVRAFVEHYSSLGAKHLVFLDNGSTDGTVETLMEYENVTVLQTELPYRTYNVAMKQYLLERFGKGRWSLLVDIDELFDYPFSDVVSLGSLLGYLNQRSYTAVVAHMLDMFPEGAITGSSDRRDVPLRELHRFYDLSRVSVRSYQSEEGLGNVASNDSIKILQGGVQKELFGINPQLTKHPLVFHDGEIRAVDRSEHWAGAARLADFSGVLFHYKMLGLNDLARREVIERRYVNRHGKYDKYLGALEQYPELTANSETARELESTNDLIGTNFNVVSAEYLDFVKEEFMREETSEAGAGSRDSAYHHSRTKQLEQILRAYSVRTKFLERRRANMENRAGNLERRNETLSERLKNVQQQNHDRQRQLESELNELRQRAQSLGATLDDMRSSRSWILLDRINKIKISLVRRLRG